MKIIFTLILVLTLSVGSFAQQKVATDKNNSFTSITESSAYSITKVYPNPAKDIVNIDIKAVSAENIRISLFNIMGVEVKVWEPFFIPEGGQLINIDLAEFKSGVYIVKFTNGTRVFSQVIRKS